VSRAVRTILGSLMVTLTIALVALILVGGFSYAWQDAEAHAPRINETLSIAKIEKWGLALYLDYYSGWLQGIDIDAAISPDDPTEIPFVIEEGESVWSVAHRLEAMGLIGDADVFVRLVQYLGIDRAIQAGAFTLGRNMSMRQMAYELQHGRMPSVEVTIPEGLRAEEIAVLLERSGVVDSADAFLRAVETGRSDYDFLVDRPDSSPRSLEGFLFPDTYYFPKNTTPQTVLDMMLEGFANRVPERLLDKIAESGRSVYEVVTLASIVEREAANEDERPTIAGVYVNRLEQNMPLQADPTVQYAMASRQYRAYWPVSVDASIPSATLDAALHDLFWPQLTRDDLNSVESPFNTYLNWGLPPGPICSPGLAAIKAAAQPEQHDYLFFLAIPGDEEQRHVFSVTYEEHLEHEQEYAQ